MNTLEWIGLIASVVAILQFARAIYHWFMSKSYRQDRIVKRSDYVWGVSFALSAALIWSISYTSLSFSSSNADPIEMTVVMLGIASLAYYLMMLVAQFVANCRTNSQDEKAYWSSIRRPVEWQCSWPWYLVAGNIGSFILFIYAFYYISASQTIALVKVNPVFVALLGVILLRRRLAWSAWLAVILVVVGLIIIVADLSNSGFQFKSGDDVVGSLLALGAGFCFAVFAISLDKMCEKYSNFVSELNLLFQVFSLSYIGVVSFAFFMKRVPQLDPAAITILCLNGLRVAIVYWIFMAAIRRIGSLLTIVIVSFEVFLTMLWDHLWLDKAPPVTLWLGAIIIVAGSLTLLTQRSARIPQNDQA